MNIIQAILMGIVQGLSEFLPISSSAHLVFTSNFYKVFKGIEIAQTSNEEVFFDIMVHLGTLIAVLIFFRKDISNIIKAMYNALKTKDWSNHEAKLGLFIIAGTVLTVGIALPINNIAEKLVYSPVIVGGLLFITGFALLYSEYKSKKIEEKKCVVDLKTSIFIGIAQGLASLPGFSRSGWTIATGLFLGLDRITSARYSFLLSIPIILGASMVYPLLEIDIQEAVTYNWSAILAGTVVSAITGYICIKYFMKFISKFSLGIFGYYCIIAGLVTAVFFSLC
jgi:undecaprenyl-diphosphatase